MSSRAIRPPLAEGAFHREFGVAPADVDGWLAAHGLEPLPEVERDQSGVAVWPYQEVLVRLTEEFSAQQAAALLGFKEHRVLYQEGFFPPPDSQEAGAGGQRSRLRWKLLTIINWDHRRPGSGRRVVPRKVKPLPAASWEGSSQRLVFAPEAASLLGFSSEQSFRSSLHQNNLPELKDKYLPSRTWEGDPDQLVPAPEAAALLGFSSTASFLSRLSPETFPELQGPLLVPGCSGETVKAWPLAMLRDVADRYGTDLERAENATGRWAQAWPLGLVARVAERRGQYPALADRPPSDGVLWGSARTATELGYTSANSFNRALGRGTFPELTEPDETRTGTGGRPKRFWKAERVKKVAADRGLQAAEPQVADSPAASWKGAPGRLVMAPEAAALLGFGSAESFRTSMEKGNLPEFKERHLPEGSWEGDSDRLVLAPEAAALLGFSSTDGFLTRLSLGDFPELRDPARAVGEYGLVHKAWPLSAVRGVARRLGTDLERVRTQDGRLLRAWPLELVARVARRRGQYPVAADDVLGSLPL